MTIKSFLFLLITDTGKDILPISAGSLLPTFPQWQQLKLEQAMAKFSRCLLILPVLCFLVIKALQCFSFSIYCNFTCKKNIFIGQQWRNSFVSASFRIVEFWFVTGYPGLIKVIIRNTENSFILFYPIWTVQQKKKYSLQENSHPSYKTKPLSRKITQPENSTSSVKSEKWIRLRRLVHTNLHTNFQIFQHI